MSEDVVGAPDGATGDAVVDHALIVLDDLGARPVDEHVEVLEDLHRVLEEHLVEQPGPGPRP